ncbi:class I adenylate-forming enzyme family protein [Pseudahrensia aquimaris]|uniref:Class I adenylate-forming enzyme family protein n=1 Tax=Pseudahrensia aquimaris TaxID=744461 RepID=A0ABW3FFM1_9HYPH
MRLGHALRAFADSTPDAVALRFEGRDTTFAELRDQVFAIAQHLRNELGIKHGDRVGYLGLNHDHMIRLVLACAEIGAMFAPLNSRLALAEYRYLIKDAEPSVLFHDDAFAETAAQLDLRHLQVEALDTLSPVSDFEAAGESGDALLLVYTSGTTGKPKGVVLTQMSVWATVENGQALYSFQSGQTVLITLPLFHVGGLCILLLPALAHGATIELHRRFDPSAALTSLDGGDITTTILVPAQMAAMMTLPEWPSAEFDGLKYIVVGSSVIPLEQIQAWHARGIPVSQIYGATETGPSAIGLRLEDCCDHEGSAGTALPLCQIEVRDAAGKSLGTDEAGDIWVRGPNVMQGYWRQPEETDKVLVDGWYNTGDIGRRDKEGFYWIIDRSKDVIISGGENIYPAEVEAASLEHEAIAAVAVVGRPDARWGETPVAVIETKAGQSLTEETFLAFLQERIARYKQPKSVVFMDALPRNVMGKVEKSVLRQMVREEG